MRPPAHAVSAAETGKKRFLWVSLVTALALLLLVVLTAAGLTKAMADRYNSSVTKINRAFPSSDERPPFPERGEQTVLLLSSHYDDTVVSYPSAEVGQWSSIHLVRFPASREAVYVISIPAGLTVTTKDGERTQLSETKALGGTKQTVTAVENLLGARINKLAIVRDNALPTAASALGVSGAAGEHPENGFGCEISQKEQVLMGAIASELSTPGALLRPQQTFALIDALGDGAHTSKDLSFRFIARMFLESGGFGGTKVNFLTVPTVWELFETQPGQESLALVPEHEGLLDLRLALADDDLSDLAGDPMFAPCGQPYEMNDSVS